MIYIGKRKDYVFLQIASLRADDNIIQGIKKMNELYPKVSKRIMLSNNRSYTSALVKYLKEHQGAHPIISYPMIITYEWF